MASSVAFAEIRTFLDARWSACPLVWENEHFDPTVDVPVWVAVEVFSDTYAQQSIGSGDPALERWTEDGTALFHVAVPRGTGSLLARQTADAIVLLLRGRRLPEDVTFRGFSLGGGAPARENGHWFILTLRSDWTRG